MAMAAGNYV
jgi:VIT1/CCC1 family predicted Fe2+/Mn2+ transporter